MDSIEGVEFYRGDVEDQKLIERITKKHGQFDVIVSDVAPSTTGNEDHEEEIELNKMCVAVAGRVLKGKGSLVMKTFAGPFEKDLVQSLEVFFEQVHRVKPKASRPSSFEEFLVCLHLKEERRKNIEMILSLEFTGRLAKAEIHRFL